MTRSTWIILVLAWLAPLTNATDQTPPRAQLDTASATSAAGSKSYPIAQSERLGFTFQLMEMRATSETRWAGYWHADFRILWRGCLERDWEVSSLVLLGRAGREINVTHTLGDLRGDRLRVFFRADEPITGYETARVAFVRSGKPRPDETWNVKPFKAPGQMKLLYSDAGFLESTNRAGMRLELEAIGGPEAAVGWHGPKAFRVMNVVVAAFPPNPGWEIRVHEVIDDEGKRYDCGWSAAAENGVRHLFGITPPKEGTLVHLSIKIQRLLTVDLTPSRI